MTRRQLLAALTGCAVAKPVIATVAPAGIVKPRPPDWFNKAIADLIAEFRAEYVAAHGMEQLKEIQESGKGGCLFFDWLAGKPC